MKSVWRRFDGFSRPDSGGLLGRVQAARSSESVVEQLLTPDALLAVECMAVLGDDRKETIASTHPRYQKLTYREGVKKGNILCISGTGAAHPVTREIVGVGDVAAQARQIYEKIKAVLEIKLCIMYMKY